MEPNEENDQVEIGPERIAELNNKLRFSSFEELQEMEPVYPTFQPLLKNNIYIQDIYVSKKILHSNTRLNDDQRLIIQLKHNLIAASLTDRQRKIIREYRESKNEEKKDTETSCTLM